MAKRARKATAFVAVHDPSIDADQVRFDRKGGEVSITICHPATGAPLATMPFDVDGFLAWLGDRA